MPTNPLQRAEVLNLTSQRVLEVASVFPRLNRRFHDWSRKACWGGRSTTTLLIKRPEIKWLEKECVWILMQNAVLKMRSKNNLNLYKCYLIPGDSWGTRRLRTGQGRSTPFCSTNYQYDDGKLLTGGFAPPFSLGNAWVTVNLRL